MQGFLLHLNRASVPKPSDFLKPVNNPSVKIYNEANPGFELITWDNGPGDFHYSYNPKKSLLIVQGYISEVEGLPGVYSQQDACDMLRSHFEVDSSSESFCDIAKRIYGSFSLIYVNFPVLKITTVSDRISSRPFWFSSKKDEIWLSSHTIPIALSSGNNEFNIGHIASYLLYATPVDPAQSLFDGIVGQKEGTILEHTLDGDGGAKEVRWYRFEHRPERQRSLGSWVNLTSKRLIEAAQRVLKTTSNPVLFLSGGVDSRIVASAIVAAGGKPLFCTLGDSFNKEMKIARMVGKLLKSDHEFVFRNPEWYLSSIRNAVFNSNGSYSWAHSHFNKAYSILRGSHSIDAALTGDFCEAFSKLCFSIPKGLSSIWSVESFVRSFDSLPLPNYQPLNRRNTLFLLKDDIREDAEKKLNRDIAERFANVSNISNDPLIVGDFFFRWQSATCIATFQMFNDIRSAGPERNLMFDKALHQLLEIMPAEIRSRKNLGARLVRKLCPTAAIIPNSNTLLPLQFPEIVHTLSKKVKPLLGKLRRSFFSNTHRTTESWQHLPLLYARHPVWKKTIETRLFDENPFPSHIFDRSAIEDCWRNFCAGNLSSHNDVERLFGFAVLRGLMRN